MLPLFASIYDFCQCCFLVVHVTSGGTAQAQIGDLVIKLLLPNLYVFFSKALALAAHSLH